jgi:PBP1b-binding outer membrane lipoprotein LpoB
MNKPFLTLLSTFLFLAGCNSVTRTKNETESEKTAKETAIEQTTTAKVDSIKVETISEAQRQSGATTTENERTFTDRITTIRQTETFFDEYRPVNGTSLSLNDRTGRTIQTEKIIQERIEVQTERMKLEYELQIERMRKDSTALVTQFETQLTQISSELIERNSELNELRKSKPNCWRCYIIPLIVLLFIVAGYFGFKRYKII